MVIYKTTNLINGKWYIGKDSTNRAYYLGSGTLLRLAIKKYGKKNFSKIILEECTDFSHLNEREIFWIAETNACADKMSYNIMSGGAAKANENRDYSKTDYSGHEMKAATVWFSSLSTEEKKAWHAKQTNKRCKGWYVSRKDDPTEIYIKNIAEWCRENEVDSGNVTRLITPGSPLFQKQTKGWRIRRSDQDPLPEYVNKQGKSRPNPIAKGRSWKVIGGKRVWVDKEEITS